jgi:hypothetical protein
MELSHAYTVRYLTNFGLGLGHSPGINERVYVVKNWEGVGTNIRA